MSLFLTMRSNNLSSQKLRFPSLLSSKQGQKVDQDVLALLPEQTQKPVKRADLDYHLISRRNKFTLGPLCKLWGNLAAARTDPETFDMDSALTLVEQTVCTVGQTHQTIEFQRRQAVLGRIIRDRQKCRDILIQNDVLLKSNKKHLFGSDFYTALSRKAKGSKRLREAKRELQGPPPKRRRFPNQPFPGGAPPVGRGGAQQSTNSGGYQQSQNFRGRPRSGRGRGRGTPSATSTSAAAGAPASQSRLGSTYLLKIDETNNSRDETFRNQMCNLSRRSHSPT